MKKNMIIIHLILIILLGFILSLSGCISTEDEVDNEQPEDGLYIINDTYWEFEFVTTQGNWGNFTIDDLEFRVIVDNEFILYKVDIAEANPSGLVVGDSKLYPISFNSSPVWDETTGGPVDQDSMLQDYMNCYITYLDQDSNGKISVGDSVYIYRDWDADNNPDIQFGYVLNIYLKNELIVEKKLLAE